MAGHYPVLVEELGIHVQGAVHRGMVHFVHQVGLEPDPVALQVILRIGMDIDPFQRKSLTLLLKTVINRNACLTESGQTGQEKQRNDP